MKVLVKAAVLASVLATAGCHITYEVKRTADPDPVVTPRSIDVTEKIGLVDQDEVSLGVVTRTEEVATYVGKNATEYHTKWSSLGAWTDEHHGFRLTSWGANDGVFPCTRWYWTQVMAPGNEALAFLTGFLLFAPPAAATMIDIMLLTILPVADGSVILVTGLADAVTGGLSAPVIAADAALTTGSPPPRTELMEPAVQRIVPEAARKLHYSSDLEGAGDGDATTTATGELRLPLGALVEKALARGHAPLVIHLATAGEPVLRHDVSIGAATLVALEESRLARTGIDRGATIGAWRKLLAGLPPAAASVRVEIQAELSRLGFFVGLDDAAALDALTKNKGGVARMADGVEVDWSSGMPSRAPKAQAEITLGEGRGEITAGQPLVLHLRVTDVGKGPLYQVHATIRCNQVAGAVVLLGKIEAGASAERRVELPTPVTLADCDANVEIEFHELNDFAPPSVQGKVHIVPAIRPVLAFSARAVDDGSGESVGNGDGVVQRGETVEYHIAVKNTGTAPAIAAHLSLTIDSTGGIAVFGDREPSFGDLAPGAVRETTITISVKPSFSKKQVPIYAILTEKSPFHVSKEQDLTLTIDEKAPRKVIAIERPIVVNEAATLLAAAEEDARSLGRVEKGSRLKAVGELDAFVQIEYAAGKHAWLRRKEVSFDMGSVPPPVTAPGQGAVSVIREFANVPPVIVFATPPEGRKTETGEAEIALKSTVKAEDGIASVRVILNGKPFEPKSESLRGIGGVKQAPGAQIKGSGVKVVSIDERIPLEPGENTIAVEATSVLGEKRSAEVVVVRSLREPVVAVLIVGIDQYADASIPALRFAEADARAVAAFFRGPKSPARDPSHVHVLLGKDATGAAIRVALEKNLIAQASHREDMAIFYFAGHGFSEDGRYFLATADTQLASLRATALKLGDLQDYWKDVRAERKVFLADACHSGGLVGLRGENAISTGVLGSIEGKGKITIAASRDKQQSCESATLGHGVFTAALLAGLEGRADQETGNRDGRVSVRELLNFLDHEVPALARQENHEQNPNYDMAEAEGEILLSR